MNYDEAFERLHDLTALHDSPSETVDRLRHRFEEENPRLAKQEQHLHLLCRISGDACNPISMLV